MASEAQRRATKKFEDKTYFKTLVRFNKKDEERIRAAAGESLNGFIVKCVLDTIDGNISDSSSSSTSKEMYELQLLIEKKREEDKKLRNSKNNSWKYKDIVIQSNKRKGRQKAKGEKVWQEKEK